MANESINKSSIDYSEVREWLMNNAAFASWIQSGAIVGGGGSGGSGGGGVVGGSFIADGVAPMFEFGDSIVNNQSGADLLGNKLASYGGGFFGTISRFATDGIMFASVQALAVTNLNYDATKVKTIAFALAGVNDLYNDQTGSSPIAANPTKAQTIAERYKALITAIKAKGANIVAVGCTIPAFLSADATRETLRTDANTLIKAQNNADCLVDLGGHFAYGNQTYCKSLFFYYLDGIHPQNSVTNHINGYDILAVLILKALGISLGNAIQAVWIPYKNKIFKGDDLPIEFAEFGGDTLNKFKWYRVDAGGNENFIFEGKPTFIDAASLPSGAWTLRLKAVNGATVKTKDWAITVLMPNSTGNGLLTPPEKAIAKSSFVDLTTAGFTSAVKWILASALGSFSAANDLGARYTAINAAETAVLRAEEEFYSTASNADNTLNGNLGTINFFGKVRLTHPNHYAITPTFQKLDAAGAVLGNLHINNRMGVWEAVSGKYHQVYGDFHFHGVEGAGAVATNVDLSASLVATDRVKFRRSSTNLTVLEVVRVRNGVDTLIYSTAANTLQVDGTTYYLNPAASFWGAAEKIGRWSIGGEGLGGEKPSGWNSAEALIYVS